MSHLHIPDGVLPWWLWVAGWLATLVAVGVTGRVAERADIRRRVPLLAVVSALMLVAMSSEIVPIAYHVNLTVIGGVLLGPVLAVIAAFIVEVVLALLGHGGVTVLGLNTVVIAAEMVVGWAFFRGLIAVAGRARVRPVAFAATVLTLALTTTALVGIVAIGGTGATARESGALDPATLRFENPFSEGVFSVGLFSGGEEDGHAGETPGGDPAASPDARDGATDTAADGEPEAHSSETGLSVMRFAAVVYTLGPLGWVLEGLLTAWVLGYVARVRPGLLWGGRWERSGGRPPGDDGTVN